MNHVKANNSETSISNFMPIRIMEVDIGQALPDLSAFDSTGTHYTRAMILVLLHSQPIGIVELALEQDGLKADELAQELWRLLKDAVVEHLHQDGVMHIPEALTAAGIASENAPQCQQEYQAAREAAPSVSIVVATHNRTDSLVETLETLLNQDYPNYDIIIVDNAPSTSATADFIQEKYGDHPKVRYVREDRPGLGRAHNRGLEEVTAEIIAFADDDIIADRHWLSWIVCGFLAANNVGCVTGMILPAELETPAQVWIEQYGGFAKGFSRRIFDMKSNRPSSPLYPYTAGVFGSGANMAFKTEALRKIGGFAADLGAGTLAMGGDDLDSFFRVVRAGYTLIYEPRAFVYHKHRREYEGLRRQAYGYGVGLSAYLTKCIIDRPTRVFDFIVKAPYGIAHIFSPQSSKNNKKQIDYPSELTRIERRGMLYGPIAYLRSRASK